MYDILIKDGTIIDGTGNPMYRADIAVKEDRIVKIGELDSDKGEIEIDAQNLTVCPGFIDVNNHSDTHWQIFRHPELKSLIHQGITTMIGGNCGTSLAPLPRPETIMSIQKWVDIREINVNWLSLGEFFTVMEKKQLPLNYATLVGHATLRRGIICDETRSPSADELAFMAGLLNRSMKEGALGMSTGLVYTHARLASTEEIVRLAKVVKDYEGVYVSHVRNEMEHLVEALEEAVQIAYESKTKLHISHLKAMGEKNWKVMEDALNLIDQVAKSGIDVTFDVYPYTNTGSVLYTMLPDWVSEGGRSLMLNRLKNPSMREKVVSEMKASGIDFSKMVIASTPIIKTLSRRKISEIAATQEKSTEDAVIDILLASEGRVIVSMEVLSEDNIKKAIAHPAAIISTNGSGYDTEHVYSGESVHPRNFGTFPKYISRYICDEKIVGWEDGIRKITGRPAEKFGIIQRGKILEKNYADLVIFGRDEIKDMATTENPYQYPKGIDFVIINGKIALSEGNYLAEGCGRILKR